MSFPLKIIILIYNQSIIIKITDTTQNFIYSV